MQVLSRQRGFTLVELMITLAISVILIAVAVPSFRNLSLTNQLATTANDVVGALSVARMEAIKRNASVQFCSNDDTANAGDTLGGYCGTDTGAVHTSVNGGDTQVRSAITSLTGALRLNGNLKAVRFNGQGLGYDASDLSSPYTGTVADICTTSLSSDNHRIVAMTAGSIIHVETRTGATCE